MDDHIFQLIVWLWVEGRTVNEMARDLGFSSRTVHGYLRKIRTLIENSSSAYSGQFDGTVYADTWSYKPKHASDAPKRPVLLGVMDARGDLRLFFIPGRKRELIHGLIKTHVKRLSGLITNESNIYSGLRVDGFPDLKQIPRHELIEVTLSKAQKINLYTVWSQITAEMKKARGVRSNNFIPRVREIELRWRFRNLPKICLFQHVIQLSRS